MCNFRLHVCSISLLMKMKRHRLCLVCQLPDYYIIYIVYTFFPVSQSTTARPAAGLPGEAAVAAPACTATKPCTNFGVCDTLRGVCACPPSYGGRTCERALYPACRYTTNASLRVDGAPPGMWCNMKARNCVGRDAAPNVSRHAPSPKARRPQRHGPRGGRRAHARARASASAPSSR